MTCPPVIRKEHSGSTLCQDAGKECVLEAHKIYNSALTVLTDHNDWGALVFSGILTSTDLSIMREVIVEDDAEDVIGPAGEHSDPIDPLAPTQITHSPPWQQVVGWALVLERLSWRQ